ncbi:hypothetical protein CAEBREN_04379 [Caenorhabditis brenneri]|uniref:Uncharacterized protein n=1 Tax=Caenorhabditis brenneri TaxID=135651 RepID=G0NFM7_CAEBE|nr:hypothetical protein CAEBREN_04379 [Caenorhabditis brenneri]
MTFSKFLHHPIQTYKDSKRIRRITEGYETHDKPYIPKIIKHSFVELKKFKSDHNVPKVGIAYGALDVKMDKTSLKNIENFLVGYLNENFSSVANSIRNMFKENTIAVAIAETNFEVGDVVGEFKVIDAPKPFRNSLFNAYKRKPSNDATFFTYRRISPNVQATYLNEGGKEFLAGIVYYPELHERYSSSDIQLIYQEQAMSDFYPYADKRNNHDDNAVYGRYCKSAGRKLLVKPYKDKKEKWPCHKIYDLEKDEWIFEECKECRDDYDEFETDDEKIEFALAVRMTDDPLPRPPSLLQKLSLGPKLFCKELNGIRKIIKKYPDRLTPHIPKTMKKMTDWQIHKNEKGQAYIAFAMADKYSNLIRTRQLEVVEEWILKFFKLSSLPNTLAPNTLAISIPWKGFQCGSHAYEFPSLDKVQEGAWFSYKRISPNIQLTMYNNKDGPEIAGMCYFLSPKGNAELLSSNIALLYKLVHTSGHPPGGALTRHCSTVGDKVLLQKSSGRHIEYNHWRGKWEYKDCRYCMKWHLVNWMINYKEIEERKSCECVSPKPPSQEKSNWFPSPGESLAENDGKKEGDKEGLISFEEPIYAKIDKEAQQATLAQLMENCAETIQQARRLLKKGFTPLCDLDISVKDEKGTMTTSKLKMHATISKLTTDVEPIYAKPANLKDTSKSSTENSSSNAEDSVKKAQNHQNCSNFPGNNGENAEPSPVDTAEKVDEKIVVTTIIEPEGQETPKTVKPDTAETEKLILDYVASICSGSHGSFYDLDEVSSLQNFDEVIVQVDSAASGSSNSNNNGFWMINSQKQ